jgi:Raf kinase inhibitor-like YbhB/YbcL family protein
MFILETISRSWILGGLIVLMSISAKSQDLTSKPPQNMVIKSNSFQHEGFIPSKYTCDGMNVSPHLEWSGFPASTKCFALICNDPDAPSGNWIHWVVANIPATVHHLDENSMLAEDPLIKIIAGINDFKLYQYRGPCPPGGIHHYYFRIYALDSFLDLKKGVSANELMKMMHGHILSEGALIGKYSRQ